MHGPAVVFYFRSPVNILSRGKLYAELAVAAYTRRRRVTQQKRILSRTFSLFFFFSYFNNIFPSSSNNMIICSSRATRQRAAFSASRCDRSSSATELSRDELCLPVVYNVYRQRRWQVLYQNWWHLRLLYIIYTAPCTPASQD